MPMDVQEKLPEPRAQQKIEETQPSKSPIRNLNDSQLGGLRRKVQRERDLTRRQMQHIRKQRAAKIFRLRKATGKTATEPKKTKDQGFFGQVKDMFSSFFRKK
jgi:hypothetical protein